MRGSLIILYMYFIIVYNYSNQEIFLLVVNPLHVYLLKREKRKYKRFVRYYLYVINTLLLISYSYIKVVFNGPI